MEACGLARTRLSKAVVLYRLNLTKAAKGNEAAMQEMWTLWKTAAEEKLDEDLFQTARLYETLHIVGRLYNSDFWWS